jgi:hypothetical protein
VRDPSEHTSGMVYSRELDKARFNDDVSCFMPADNKYLLCHIQVWAYAVQFFTVIFTPFELLNIRGKIPENTLFSVVQIVFLNE